MGERWKSWDSAPKNGDEILVRYPRQGNVKILARYSAIYGFWSSKGEPVLGIDNQECEWCAVPDDADCATYEARIAELEDLVRRVKAESLRVVEDDSESFLFVRYQGDIYKVESLYPSGELNASSVTTDDAEYIPAGDNFEFVRLEHWETEE